MSSRILPGIAAGLVVLLVVGRLGRERPAPAAAPADGTTATQAVRAMTAPAAAAALAPADRALPPARLATPAIDRMVTLAARQRIERERRHTYIDSLLHASDSLVRRWPDRDGRALRVAIVDAPELPGWRAALPAIARRALAAWQDIVPGIRFEAVGDETAADIAIRWIERFGIERTGQTDLQYLPTGIIQRAEIQLALRTLDDQPLRDEGLLAVAVHEVGHALGLPHSGSAEDVMYPDTRTARVSPRDRATAVLLYSVAPGSLRLEP